MDASECVSVLRDTAQMNAAAVMAPTTNLPHGSASSLRTQAIGAARQAPALVLAQTASKPATCSAAPPTHAAKGTGGGMASRSTGVEPVFVVMLESTFGYLYSAASAVAQRSLKAAGG